MPTQTTSKPGQSERKKRAGQARVTVDSFLLGMGSKTEKGNGSGQSTKRQKMTGAASHPSAQAGGDGSNPKALGIEGSSLFQGGSLGLDIISRIGHTVLRRAELVRLSLVESVRVRTAKAKRAPNKAKNKIKSLIRSKVSGTPEGRATDKATDKVGDKTGARVSAKAGGKSGGKARNK